MHKKLLLAYLEIPKIRDGKASADAILSYRKDCEMYHRLLTSYFMAPEKGKQLLNEWGKYIKLRNYEDYCMHTKSVNYSEYQTMFDWRT